MPVGRALSYLGNVVTLEKVDIVTSIFNLFTSFLDDCIIIPD